VIKGLDLLVTTCQSLADDDNSLESSWGITRKKVNKILEKALHGNIEWMLAAYQLYADFMHWLWNKDIVLISDDRPLSELLTEAEFKNCGQLLARLEAAAKKDKFGNYEGGNFGAIQKIYGNGDLLRTVGAELTRLSFLNDGEMAKKVSDILSKSTSS
jgi:hypothetical protein